MTNSLSKSGVGARDACAYKNAFTAIGWKHPRDWMWPFARHIPHSSEKKRLKDQSWKWFVLEKKNKNEPIIVHHFVIWNPKFYFKGFQSLPDNNRLFGVSGCKTVCDQISLRLPRLSLHCLFNWNWNIWCKNDIWSAPFWKFPLQFRPQREIRGSRRNGRFNSEIFLTKASLSLLGNLKMESRAEKYCSSI